MIKLCFCFLALTTILAGCGEYSSKKENGEINVAVNNFYQIKCLQDDLVYSDNQLIEINFYLSDNNTIVFDKNESEYRIITNNSKKSNVSIAELRYHLKEVNDSLAILSVAVFEKNENGQFTVSKMNLGSTNLTFISMNDLRMKLNKYLALATYKYDPDE